MTKINHKIKVERKSVGGYTSIGYKTVRAQGNDGLSFSSASGDRHLKIHRTKLIAQSRDFLRNNGLYKGMISQAVNYMIATGFHLQMTSRSRSYNEKVEKLWKSFWKRPEIRGILSGRMVERMVCRELIVAGDALAVKTDKSLIQLIEAEQITNGSGSDGIEKDANGTPSGYFIAPYGTTGRTVKPSRYDPKSVIFITNPDRPSSTRGVPVLQASFPNLHRVNDIADSEALAWQILSRLAISITRQGSSESAYLESKADPDLDGTDTEGELATRLIDLGTALVFNGEVGDEVKGIDRNIPAQNFPESIRTFLRMIGLPLGMPIELVLLDWTKSNYSQTRAVLEHAYQTFIGYQALLEDFFHDEVLKWKISHWIESKEIKERNDGLDHNWIKPTFPWIDQLKEAQAHGAKIDRSFTTHSHVCKSLGIDRDEIISSREQEIRDAIDRSKKIEQETGVKVSWKIFAGLEDKSGGSAPAKPDQEEKEEEDTEEKDQKNVQE